LAKAPKKKLRPRKQARGTGALKWILAAAAIVLVVYAASQMSGVAFTDKDIKVVDFSNLTSTARRSALQAANQARCSCGCGMTLAQCVATDSTCPIRETNVERIKSMVREAQQP
jgi:hypothetical protein